jgi:hypothetical protein
MSITKLNNLSVSALTALPSGLGGKVLQVVSATDSTLRTTTSTSYVTASNTLSVTITPASASNKILLLVSVVVGNGNAYDCYLTIYKGGSNLIGASGFVYQSGGGTSVNYNSNAINYLDSPATTSATTYQVYFKVNSGTGNINVDSARGVITAIEIAG